MVKRIYQSSLWIAAGLLAVLLPFTSFPLVARLTGSQMVAPLSFLPMAFLLIFWLVPYLLRSETLPSQTKPLFVFGLIVLISAGLAFFLPIPAFKGIKVINSEARALATLAVGFGFYFVIVSWVRGSDRICFLLRWMNWGGVLVLAWSLIQGIVWYRMKSYPDWMWHFQGMVSTSLLLYGQRANGFAYEPSWLAHQLNMLYLPYWLAASVTGFSAHRFRIWKLHFENLLLLGGVVVMVLSVSRVGLLAFLLMVAFQILRWNLRLVRFLQARVTRAFPAESRQNRQLRTSVAVGSVVALVILYAGLLFGAAYGLSRYDPRMQRVFDFAILKEAPFEYFANQLVFAERYVFWQAGWGVFNDYPILGVGLGNAGYFFPEKLSSFSLALTEVRVLLYQWTSLPNIKSLWVRLLAETGIIGFAAFLSWCYLLWQSAAFLRSHRARLFKTIGAAGSFALIGFLIEGFSIDTFALPYYWITFGLITIAVDLALKNMGSTFSITGESLGRAQVEGEKIE